MSITYQDFIHSDKADQNNINNTPDPEIMMNCIMFLKMVVEPLEELFAPNKVVIHSGYRCPTLNTLLKGSKTSFHMKGMAIDFHVSGMTLGEAYQTIKNSDLTYQQFILEGSGEHQWLHYAFDLTLPKDQQKMQLLKIPNP